MKNLLFLGIALIVLVIVIGVVFQPKHSSSSVTDVPYFDENAKVMYFWQESCHYCQQQKPILQQLANENGLKVKSMDVGNNPDLWKQYSIEGTPTFIAPDGQKLVGLQEKEKLKTFLEKYK